MGNKKIKVLIVEDSLIFSKFLIKMLEDERQIEVIGVASNPYEARDIILQLQPDVMTMDLEMPKMNGIDFLKKLIPQHPLPVIVVSGHSEKVFDAMNSGAVDFITKPAEDMIERFQSELIMKIKIASISKTRVFKVEQRAKNTDSDFDMNKIIAIGASTGGTEATLEILKNLPANMPGIVITQHMPQGFTKMYAERLNRSCALDVKEAQDGDIIEPGRVLLAPGNLHMEVVKKLGKFKVVCRDGDKVSGHRPSVDVLFRSLVKLNHSNAIGAILTGMGADGAKGLLELRSIGAKTIGQDSRTCVVYGMPKVAKEIGAVEKEMPLEKIADYIIQCSKVRLHS